MSTIRFRASCPCEACARLAGVITVSLAEDERAAMGRRPVALGGGRGGRTMVGNIGIDADEPAR